MNENWTGTAAYDLSAYEAIPRGAHYQSPRKLVVRTTVQPKSKTSTACVLMCALCVVAFIFTIIINNAAKVEMGEEIRYANARLTALGDEYEKLTAGLETSANAAQVRDYASASLGLSAIENYQVSYIQMGNHDTVVRNSSAMGTTVRDALSQSMDGVLEYLKLR